MAHDIFVSYAHIDDQKTRGLAKGWVSYFIEELEKEVAKKLGRHPDVWKDEKLLKNEQVDATLYEKVRDSKTIVLFMSPSYLNSEWCRKEIGNFLTLNSAHKNKESVFIVAVEKTNREKWHQRLQALTPLELYLESRDGSVQRLGHPSPPRDDSKDLYWTKLNELAHLIKKQLELLNEIQNNAADPDPQETSVTNTANVIRSKNNTPTVWIAQPTVDLHSQWEALASSIRQRGAQILPVGHSTYPLDSSDLHAILKNDLSQSDLFIQLLSTEVGDAAKFLQLQALSAKMCAIEKDLPFLQWRLENIDLQTIADPKHRELLQGTIACGFEQFRQLVLEKLDQLMNPITKDPMSKPNQGELSLCITAGEKDSELTQKIADLLVELNHVPFPIPPVLEKNQSIVEYNADLRSLLNDVDGIILAHSQENEMWLQGQRAKVRKALAQRPLPWGAFVDSSPPDRQPIRWNDPGFMYLDCRNGLSVEPIQQFINTLQKGV